LFIKYSGTNCHTFGQLPEKGDISVQGPKKIAVLRPGWNEFPANIWEQYKTHPSVKKMMEKGTLELLETKVVVMVKGKKVIKKIGSNDNKVKLTYFEEKKAISIVKDTYNRDILNRWLDEETRPKVIKAIQKQVEPLLPGDKEDGDDDDSED